GRRCDRKGARSAMRPKRSAVGDAIETERGRRCDRNGARSAMRSKRSAVGDATETERRRLARMFLSALVAVTGNQLSRAALAEPFRGAHFAVLFESECQAMIEFCSF